ncbi:MAG: DUF262 domain-containing protein [Calditrichaeota bacterium]|nr:MAG: DUF262 domain-containing protein [Calditrichota bacterium]
MANFLDSKTQTYNDLIGNGKIYKVPRFQRDYSWSEEYWEDLWFDILSLEEEPVHYMGYLVFQTKDNEEFEIIDGQQRLTTLSLFSLALIKNIQDLIDENIDSENNKKRITALRNQFLGYTDPASLIPTSKLFLNKNNNDFYQSYPLCIRTPKNIRILKKSEKLIWGAFEYFYKRIKEEFKTKMSGLELANYLNKKVARNLVFTVINVENELNAYKVFETLNARGVKLSTTDLLKNYLFSIVAKRSSTELDQAERQWTSINTDLGNTDFPTYLRHFWNSRNKLVRKQSLFKEIKKQVQSAEQVFALLNELEDLAPIYVSFSNPTDSSWNKEQTKHLQTLKLFRIVQCYPLLISAFQKLEKNQITNLLKDCVTISFRYNIVSGLNPNSMEDVYNKTAIKVFQEQFKTSTDIFTETKALYVDDETFRNNFSTKIISTKRSKKLVQYILIGIENQIGESNFDFLTLSNNITIEHILPENPLENWEETFSIEEQENYIYRIGNYTLLESKKNNLCATKNFEEKSKIYETSKFHLSSKKTDFAEWNPDTLRERQNQMAKIATTVWKINYA